ncbi:condensation domain-containing protein [Amycolatopsis sp. NPDC059021]|uniref:condensation domain-containing protein n=1 Tax=Amycolatopsis sp. NPDC059021 TaxID=3346704 RepID=UPI00366B9814
MSTRQGGEETAYLLRGDQLERWTQASRGATRNADQISTTYLLTGPLDTSVLQRAFCLLSSRHDALRLRIVNEHGGPKSVLRPAPGHFPLPVIDTSNVDEDVAVPICELYRAREAAVPLDLSVDAPLRAMLLRLAPDRHVLLLTVSHLVADGWSCGALVRDLQRCYRHAAGGPVPRPVASYAEFIAEDAADRTSTTAREDLAWWLNHLAGAPWRVPLARAGTDRADNGYDTFNIEFVLPEHLGRAARALASGTGATVYCVCLTALALCLAQWTGRRETMINATYAGRDEEKYDDTVGLMSNRLPLRIPVRPGDTVAELVREVGEIVLDAMEHRHAPFDAVLRALRERGDSPELQTTLQLYPRAMCEARAQRPGDLDLRLLDFRAAGLHYDVALFLVEPDDEPFTGVATLRTRTFGVADAREFLARYQQILADITRDADTPVTELLHRVLPARPIGTDLTWPTGLTDIPFPR